MTIAELIKELEKFPADAKVFVPEEGSFAVDKIPAPELCEDGAVRL